ncbi:hypothetical protein [Clostridium sp. 'White wine YQ']|uniref:hypothetical protein n=1 Tax=Clostridium sp. 'White wine YQ' TaxID=3027474 RepID=UPI002365D6D6|nr:hypothetical protein [Clostridium sp. 'White wine YQ']MDD7794486.1 hypothetical protein [Clostridium sp. 'White wine YQ']
MQLEAAIIHNSKFNFALIPVDYSIVINSTTAKDVQASFAKYFPGLPIVLMSENDLTIPTYFGRKDILRYLTDLNPSSLSFEVFNFDY